MWTPPQPAQSRRALSLTRYCNHMATIIVRLTRTKSTAGGHSLTYGSAILSIHSVLRRVRLFVEGINNNLQTLNLKHRMRFEPTDEILGYDNSCALKIRATAVLALKELDPLPSSGRVTQEVFEAEVKRITQEKLRPLWLRSLRSP